MVAPEIFPLAKTGGLADVASALSRALVKMGVEVTMVMPAYQTALGNSFKLEDTGMEVNVPMGRGSSRGIVLKTSIGEKLPVYLIQADRYFLRENLYGTSQGDYPDNAERFAFFAKATLELAQRTGSWDVIHCHDWQTALIPVLKTVRSDLWPGLRQCRTLLTVHNLGYQGTFPPAAWEHLNLDWAYFSPSYLEFYGQLNILKGGILFSDALTTVSRRYASEIKTPEYGHGLEGVIREREKNLHGILNGVDYQEWNPQTDPHIKKNYHRRDLRGKALCKKDLQAIYGFPVQPSVPLLGIVSRLVAQKGLDILVEAMEELMRLDLQMAVLGTGEHRYHELLSRFAAAYPGKLGVRIGYDNVLAHKIEAGADLFLMPSQFEPCGLNQIYSLRYGTIPIVRGTGGLDDTIEDYNPATGAGNGFKFGAYSAQVLLETVKRAVAVYHHKQGWRRLIANAMAGDFSWKESAAEYFALYRKLADHLA